MNPEDILLSPNAIWHERLAALGILHPHDDGVKAIQSGEMYPKNVQKSLQDKNVCPIIRVIPFMELKSRQKNHVLEKLDEPLVCVIVLVEQDDEIRMAAFEKVTNINLLYLILRYSFDVEMRKNAACKIPAEFSHLLRTALWLETNPEVRDCISENLVK